MNKIIIKISYCDQLKDTKDKKWAGKTCAICCLKMMLAFKNKKYLNLQIMTLVDQALRLDGYLNGIGWKHEALVNLAKIYGIKMKFKKKFYYTKPKKLRGLKFIDSKINKKEPVIVSIFNKKGGSHAVVLFGMKEDNGATGGYYVKDPNSKNKKEDFLEKNSFLKEWRGGLITFA